MPGGVFFNENDFFTCSSGLFPAQFASTSQSKNISNDVKFLTVQDKVCRKQDFSCKWIVVLAAAIAALCVTGVGAMLVAALVGACIGLGLAMTLCGSMASMARNWLQPKTDVLISGNMGVTQREGPLMTCSLFGGNITAAPNIEHQWQAILIGSAGTVMAGLEGFMYATAFRGAGTLLKSPAMFFKNVGGNYLATLTKWGLAGRTAFAGYGAMQQHYVQGENGAGNLAETFARGFAFEADMADRWVHGKGHIQDIALIFSMGGIPAPPRAGNRESSPDSENNRSGNEDGNPLVRAADDAEGSNGETNRTHEDPVSLDNGTVGALGEQAVVDRLRAAGYTEILQIQNNSGHGVDVIARDPLTGNVKAVEVKANGSRLSEAQQRGGEWYVNDRLNRAANGDRGYGIPPNSPELRTNAETAQEWIRDAPRVDYEVHKVPVDRTTGVTGATTTTSWDPPPPAPPTPTTP